MKVTPSEMNKMRQLNKRMKRLYWERHWKFTRRKKQLEKIGRVSIWRSVIDGTACEEEHEDES